MATRRFCDICDKPLTNADVQPLVREFVYRQRGADGEILPDVAGEEPIKNKVVAYVEITNANNHPLTDICIECRLRVVSDGTPVSKPTAIATLQPMVASDVTPRVELFAAPEIKPSALLSKEPPHPLVTGQPVFVPSMVESPPPPPPEEPVFD